MIDAQFVCADGEVFKHRVAHAPRSGDFINLEGTSYMVTAVMWHYGYDDADQPLTVGIEPVTRAEPA